MEHLIEFPLDDGTTVLVQATDGRGPVLRGGREGEVVERAQVTFEAALDRIRPAVDRVLARLRSDGARPDAITVEFKIGLSAEAGAFIASAGANAQIGVSMRWERPER